MSLPLIAGIAVLVIIVAIALSQRSSGPRVTQIDRVIEEDKRDSDGDGPAR